MKNIKNAPISQHKHTHPAINHEDTTVFNKNYSDKPDNVVRNIHTLNSSAIAVLDILVEFSFRCKRVFVSHDEIARQAKLSRRQVIRCVEQLRKAMLIRTIYFHMHSLIYQLPHVFNEHFPRKEFKQLLSSYKWLQLALLLSKPALADDVTLLVIKGIYTKPGSLVSMYISKPRESANANQAPNFIKKRRKVMEAHQVSEFIKNIRSINLTESGQIELSRFSDGVIREALTRLQAKRVVDNPFRYLFSVAKLISQDKNIEINHAGANRLLTERGINFDDPKYLPGKPLQREGSGVSNNASSFSVNTNNSRSGQQLEKVAPKRVTCTWNYESGQFIAMKCAEYGLDFTFGKPGWVEYVVKDALAEKGYSRAQLNADYAIWQEEDRTQKKELYTQVPQKELMEECIRKINVGFLKTI